MSTPRTPVDQCGDQRSVLENATFGAARSPPSESICSFVFGNINGLPKDNLKKDNIKAILTGSNGFMFCEHNSKNIPTSTLRALPPSHYGKSCSIATNIVTPRTEPAAYGGTGMIVDNFLSKFLLERGVDDR